MWITAKNKTYFSREWAYGCLCHTIQRLPCCIWLTIDVLSVGINIYIWRENKVLMAQLERRTPKIIENDLKKMKNGRRPQQNISKMTLILRQSCWDYLTTKTSKTNGFDTIEIDLVLFYYSTVYSYKHKNRSKEIFLRMISLFTALYITML